MVAGARNWNLTCSTTASSRVSKLEVVQDYKTLTACPQEGRTPTKVLQYPPNRATDWRAGVWILELWGTFPFKQPPEHSCQNGEPTRLHPSLIEPSFPWLCALLTTVFKQVHTALRPAMLQWSLHNLHILWGRLSLSAPYHSEPGTVLAHARCAKFRFLTWPLVMLAQFLIAFYQRQLLEPRVEVFSRLLLLPTSSTPHLPLHSTFSVNPKPACPFPPWT